MKNYIGFGDEAWLSTKSCWSLVLKLDGTPLVYHIIPRSWQRHARKMAQYDKKIWFLKECHQIMPYFTLHYVVLTAV